LQKSQQKFCLTELRSVSRPEQIAERNRDFMETRIAIIGIIIYNNESAEKINSILHDYAEYIVGRMGIPYKTKSLSVISVIIDAPNDTIGALSGKLGMIPDISVKTMYSKV
jgi:putative iron-only hydrogenase system regulator